MFLLFGKSAPTPKSIFGSALWSWQDASDTSTITIGTGVSNWADKSGNSRPLTQGTALAQPTYTSGISVNFTTTTYYMALAASIGATYDCYVVMTTLNSNANWRSVLYNQLGNHPLILETGTNRLGEYHGAFQDSGLTIAVSTKKVILLKMAASVPSYAINGVTFSDVADTMPFPDPTHICTVPYGFGNLHEIIMVNENSTTAKRTAMVNALMSKWSVT